MQSTHYTNLHQPTQQSYKNNLQTIIYIHQSIINSAKNHWFTHKTTIFCNKVKLMSSCYQTCQANKPIQLNQFDCNKWKQMVCREFHTHPLLYYNMNPTSKPAMHTVIGSNPARGLQHQLYGHWKVSWFITIQPDHKNHQSNNMYKHPSTHQHL